MSKKILIVTGDGGESYEVLYALHRFQEAGHEAHIAAPSQRRLNLVKHEFKPGWDTYYEGDGYAMDAHMAFEDVLVDYYDAVLLIGGRAPEYLRNNPLLIRIVREFNASGKWIYSICHGIQILATAGLLKGKNITCYEHCRYEAESAGGTWIDEEAVMEGHIICGQTWMSHPQFYRLIFDNLG